MHLLIDRVQGIPRVGEGHAEHIADSLEFERAVFGRATHLVAPIESMIRGAYGPVASAISSRERPKKLCSMATIGISSVPAILRVSCAIDSSQPITATAAGTPFASAAIMSRTLRDVHVAQSPAAMTSAVYRSAIAAAQISAGLAPS